MFTLVNINQAKFQQATGRIVAELASAAVTGAEGVTCRVVEIFPEHEGGARMPHTHYDMEEVIFVLEGQGKVWVEERERVISRDDLIVVPMKMRHRIINLGDKALRLLCFFPGAQVEIP
ncbi:cupin domain-containing protein [Desulfosporosinus fructosivorans]|uniref:Cupin domain-containing protein n=1 Tax=Desulfosporosinus fructosivorans TaxID=2018669 RepID=A0A4Z0R8F2_9FIRM|nr:cupin domain-containing protein [Desulfosporosinus fructosivorans]TGE39108.1 cupin domain-containing protein [Desulfosporosinus fructosivorans]